MKIGKLYGIIFMLRSGGQRCFNGLWKYLGVSEANGEKSMIFTDSDGEIMKFDERILRQLRFWPAK